MYFVLLFFITLCGGPLVYVYPTLEGIYDSGTRYLLEQFSLFTKKGAI